MRYCRRRGQQDDLDRLLPGSQSSIRHLDPLLQLSDAPSDQRPLARYACCLPPASAGARSAYLTVSETFPVEIRAEAIAVFFAIAQVCGAVGPVLFGALIGNGKDAFRLSIGYLLGGGIMVIAGIVELLPGVAAEGRELEQVARPLTAVSVTQVRRAPMPRADYSLSSKPAGPSSAAA